MGKYEDLIERLRDVDEDLAEEFEAFKGSSLRQKAERTEALEKESADLKLRITELEEAPKREKAFKEYGVDLEGLKPAEKEKLAELKIEGELTAEKIGEIVQKYDLPMLEANEDSGEEDSDEPPAAKIAEVASRGGQRSSSPVITPKQAAEWSTEKWMRFEEAHPREAEAVSRGEKVVGISFT